MIDSIDLSILESIELDEHGFITDLAAWTIEIAKALAASEDIELTDQHWEAINFSRTDYNETGKTPKLRWIAQNTSLSVKDLYKLFPGGPARVISKVSGLPRPAGCF